MAKTTALIFGYNNYAKEIRNNVIDKYERIRLFALEGSEVDEDDKAIIEYFDLSDEWNLLGESVDIENSIVFCVLENTAENTFLTLSLRSHFSDLSIIAVASNKENANKLQMAGATKVIPLIETTADIITNMLEKPISSKILHSILYEESALKIAQIKITKESRIKDEAIRSIDWTRYNGIIVLSVMRKDMKSEFIYSSRAKHHVLEEGDVLVVVGYEMDIQEFENKIGSKRYVDWSNWSW